MAAGSLLPSLCADSSGHGCVVFQLPFGPQMWCRGVSEAVLHSAVFKIYSSGVVVFGKMELLKILHKF